ncbi:MAG: Gfo/Idh/MocA family protein [Acidimicrobiales bacterium]
MAVVRIGVLGAARIAPAALLKPARHVPEAQVRAVAARDRSRAEAFASKHGVGLVHDDYATLVEDPELDAVYVPLPNGLHAEWAAAALRAGKHVLCEKPLTNNATEARSLAAAAQQSGRVLMEAFHYRYHPVAVRAREIVASGAIGRIEHVETWMCFPLPRFADIRYQYDLGGGALMDAGCYSVHLARLLGLEEPEVVSARAKLRNRDVDRAMTADLRFGGGHTGTIHCSMWSGTLLRMGARVRGSGGELRITNPFGPHVYHRLRIATAQGRSVEHLSKRPTYEFQLEAFCGAVLRGEPIWTGPEDSVANMEVIDAIYAAAGMRLRGD